MRIAYVCYWNAFAADGVSRKVDAQIGAWRALGHEVEVFCLTRDRPGEPVLRGRLYRWSSTLGRLAASTRLARDARGWRPDLVYVRQDLWAPPVLLLVRRLRSVVEVNGYDETRQRRRRRVVRALRRLGYAVLLRAADGFVVVTPALERRFAHYGKAIEVVTNGVDLAGIEPAAPAANGRPRLVFVGSPGQEWQGTDKLVRLAGLLPEVDVDVVGVDAALLGAVPANVTVHGWLDRDGYAGLLAGADVGVGPLALHRKRLEEAAALKVREYLGYGLPVLLAGDDGDFVGDEPWYLLRLPNAEDNVETRVEEIRAFVARVAGRRVPRAEVADRIDANVKERRRVDFFARVAA